MNVPDYGFNRRVRINKKGFALTLDAAIAVIIALIMITGATFYLSQNSHLNLEDPQFIISMDSLAMLEKNGGLGDYITSGSTTKINGLLSGLPYESCIRLTFYYVEGNGGMQKAGSLGREGCGYPEDYAIARRLFISGGSVYLAELVGWRR